MVRSLKTALLGVIIAIGFIGPEGNEANQDFSSLFEWESGDWPMD